MVARSFESPWPLRRSALLGAAAGLRSQMPFAVIASAARRGELEIDRGELDGWLRDERVARLVTISTIGELMIDKLPFIPPRTDPESFIGRLFFGALAGAIGARHDAQSLSAGATTGALAAGIAATIGTTIRQNLPDLANLPAITVALIEDAITYLIACEGIKPIR